MVSFVWVNRSCGGRQQRQQWRPVADEVRQLPTTLMLVSTIIRFVPSDQRGLPIAYGKFGRG